MISPSRRKVIIILVILCIVISACNDAAKKIIIDTACSPPCWRNITPGKTDQDELLSLLKNMPDVKNKEILLSGPNAIFDNVVRVSLRYDLKVELYILNEKVTLIIIDGKSRINYSEATSIFGMPDVIIATSTLGPSRFLFGDSPILYISSLNPSKGTGFGFSTLNRSMKSYEEIDPNTMITNFFYYDPSMYERLINNASFSMGNNDYKIWLPNKQ